MAVGFEGTRNFDWGEAGAESPPALDDGFLTASDAALKAYSEAHLEYVSAGDRRVSAAFFNGQCGCGGGASGVHAVAYSANGSFSNTSGYDVGWHARAVVAQPDGTYLTQYFDEVGQPLTRVVTSGDPAGSPAQTWVTHVTRSAEGVTAVYAPSGVASYTHSTGAVTTNNSSGSVTKFDRVSGGDAAGLKEAARSANGGTATANLLNWKSHTLRALEVGAGPSTVVRPVTGSDRGFHTETTSPTDSTKYDQSSQTFTWWSATATDVLYIVPKSIATQFPAVTTANNGPNTATSGVRYLRRDGTAAFTLSTDGVYTYTKYADGLMVKRIDDAQTNHVSDFASGDDPNGDFGITETGDGLRVVTTYAYDAQGRPASTTLPSGRVAVNYYTRLADGRMVTIAFPRFEEELVDEEVVLYYYGPASYTVTNHAGRVEFQGVIAAAGISTALSSWIDETDADPVTALDVGTLARMSTSLYDEAGSRLLESRAYFKIPASGAGTAGTNYDAALYAYDAALYAYDAMGRRLRAEAPDGTISRTVYDALGRTTERHIGTDDTGWGGSPGGSFDMVKAEELVYDGGSGGGDSHLTSRTAFIQDNSTGQRVTTYTHDFRGRVLLVTNPQAPHVFSKYDNLGRAVATGLFSSTASINLATDDPATETANRVGLSQTLYDQLGRVWKTIRHKIDGGVGGDGSDDDTLEALTWYDAGGRVAKTQGEQLSKTFYDRLGRVTNQFVLASTNDTAYAHALDASGDYVLEEHRTYVEPATGHALMRVSIARHYDDTSTTGPLDIGTNPALVDYSGNKIKGRAQITAFGYDPWDRPEETVAYGTNGGTNFDRDGVSFPVTRSDTELVTTTTYNDDGTVGDVTDPRGLVTRTEYDDLGRRTASIANYVNGTPSGVTGDDDVYTRYVYSNGHMTQMWVDLDGDGTQDATPPADQVTTYTYGVSKGASAGDSKIGHGGLLWKVAYPDSSSGTDVVTFAYNAQGQEVWKKDQAGNVFETSYDTAGRVTYRDITTLASGFDGAVMRVGMTYTARGQVERVTQYDAVVSGAVTDEVMYTYDDWGNVAAFDQDRDSTVGGGGGAAYGVSWAHAKSAPSTGRHTIQRTSVTLPGSSTWTYDYDATAMPSINLDASRVYQIKQGGTAIVTYKYNGVANIMRTYLEEPDAFYDLDGTSARSYTDLDRFDRAVGSAWTKDLATDRDFYSVTLTYDRNSNITSATDNIFRGASGGGGSRNFDVKYSIDALNRVTRAEEGQYASGSISSRSRDEQWLDGSGNIALTQTGNWERHRLDLDGNGNFTNTGDLDDTRAHNAANEMLTRDIDSDTNVDYTLVHDDVGNLTDDGQTYKFVYDAWGRLRQVKKQNNDLVAEYRYNGLGHRISWHYDADADNDVDGNDPVYYFVYDDQWRIVATFRESDANAKERFVYHAAGLGGFVGAHGGIGGYIDHVVLRDKDANSGWVNAGDGTLEERVYYCQNWRADVSAILNASGKLVEWIKYSAYGTPIALPAGDTDSDGDWDATDSGNITTAIFLGSPYNVRNDANLDGSVTSADITHANSITGSYQTLGRGVLSSLAVANRKAYAGYENDGAIVRFYHVRHRAFDHLLGRWLQRDPLEYVDCMSMYEYAYDAPLTYLDPFGLQVLPPQPQPCPGSWGDCLTCAGGLIGGGAHCWDCINRRTRREALVCWAGCLGAALATTPACVACFEFLWCRYGPGPSAPTAPVPQPQPRPPLPPTVPAPAPQKPCPPALDSGPTTDCAIQWAANLSKCAICYGPDRPLDNPQALYECVGRANDIALNCMVTEQPPMPVPPSDHPEPGVPFYPGLPDRRIAGT